MKNNLTEIVFILDRSGSMSGLETDTIGGYNSMLKKQQKEKGAAYITTILFDDRIELLHDRRPIEEIRPITGEDYYVRGSTALLDAVGGAIHHIGNCHKYARDEDVPEKTLFIITTDGMENASREYSYERVRRMIEHQKERYQWEFIFMGANIDAVEVASRFGVDRMHSVRYEADKVGTQLNYKMMSNLVSKARHSKSAQEMNEVFAEGDDLDEIRRDYEKRGKDGRK